MLLCKRIECLGQKAITFSCEIRYKMQLSGVVFMHTRDLACSRTEEKLHCHLQQLDFIIPIIRRL